jgi:hypothetical protein
MKYYSTWYLLSWVALENVLQCHKAAMICFHTDFESSKPLTANLPRLGSVYYAHIVSYKNTDK